MHRLLEVMSCHSWSSCTWIIQGLIGLCVWFGGYFVVRFFLQKSKIWIRLDLEQGPRVVLPSMKVLFGTLGIYYIFYHASLHGMKTSYLESIRPIRDTLLVLSLFGCCIACNKSIVAHVFCACMVLLLLLEKSFLLDLC